MFNTVVLVRLLIFYSLKDYAASKVSHTDTN